VASKIPSSRIRSPGALCGIPAFHLARALITSTVIGKISDSTQKANIKLACVRDTRPGGFATIQLILQHPMVDDTHGHGGCERTFGADGCSRDFYRSSPEPIYQSGVRNPSSALKLRASALPARPIFSALPFRHPIVALQRERPHEISSDHRIVIGTDRVVDPLHQCAVREVWRFRRSAVQHRKRFGGEVRRKIRNTASRRISSVRSWSIRFSSSPISKSMSARVATSALAETVSPAVLLTS
jgi:hypothetical protein